MRVKVQLNNQNIITGYFYLESESPYRATGCNWYENLPSIEIEISSLDLLKVGEQKLIKNRLIDLTDTEKEEYRKSLENNQ